MSLQSLYWDQVSNKNDSLRIKVKTHLNEADTTADTSGVAAIMNFGRERQMLAGHEALMLQPATSLDRTRLAAQAANEFRFLLLHSRLLM